MSSLFAELKRRKVVSVAITYGVVGIAVIAAADIIVDAVKLPPQFMVFVIVAIFLGLPIAIVLAWSYNIVRDTGGSPTNAEIRTDDEDTAANRSGYSHVRALVAVAVLAIVAVTWHEFSGTPTALQSPFGVQYLDSVAVMPLDNRTGDPGYDHVGIGITEEIIAHLSRIAPLKVISRHSVQAVSDQDLTFPELGTALNVRHVIGGSIHIDNDRLRVMLQQVNAESDSHVWSENFRRPLGDVTGFQEDIARFATSKFAATIPGLNAPQFEDHVDLGPGQKAYLTGQQWLGQRTAEGLNNAISHFHKAIELDPGFAPAYADLASAYALSIFYRYEAGADSYTLAAQSLAFAEHALALDPDLAAGYASRGYLGALIGRPARDVAADFDRAASLQPNAASIPSWRARSLAELGQTEAAFSEASRAVDLDPLAPGRHIALAELSLQLGRYDQAIASAKMASALEPRLIRSHAIEARALLLKGQPQRCAEMLLGPHRVLRATCFRASGRSSEAAAIIEEALENIRNDRLGYNGYTEVILFEDLAVDYAMRGDAENALFWSAKAYATSPVGLEIRILESALFDKVRDDPNFANSIAAIRGDLYDRVRRDSEQFR